MRVDSHQHFWKIDRGDYGWLTPQSGVLYRDYVPADLRCELAAAGIDRTVLVQAAETDAETDFLLEIAAQTDFVAGVVGWLDFESDTFGQRLADLQRHAKFVGVRPMLQEHEDNAYILRPRVLDNLRHLSTTGLAFDFLTFTRHLGHVLEVLDKVPGLKAVIDHISKPLIANGQLEPWRRLIAEVAAHPSVYCKISGMVTEAEPDRWTEGDIRPFSDTVVASFGPRRIMFGSDWPVCLGQASYAQVVALADRLTDGLTTEAEKADFFGGNATHFYDLKLID